MSHALRIREICVYQLAIPMRLRFEHAAASRQTADPVIVALHAQGPPLDLVGWGETLARPYVTGETAESAACDVSEIFVPLLAGMRVHGFSEALEFAESLPFTAPATDAPAAPPRCVQAARAAVELAIIDLAGRTFGRRAADVADWVGRVRGTATAAPRYSGMVVGPAGWKCTALLRLQRLYGLRDFKMKLATSDWRARLECAHRVLRTALSPRVVTLRGDANGAWTPAETAEAAPLLARLGVSVIEQPIAPSPMSERMQSEGGVDSGFPAVAAALAAAGVRGPPARVELMCDESLVTLSDCRQLLAERSVEVFNIRIAKQGGLLAALRMAQEVSRANRDVQIGCMVGETSILSAAGAAFAEAFPPARFREGAFGRWLLKQDVARAPLQFGFGGSLPPLGGKGLGVDVDPAAVERLTTQAPVRIVL